MSIRLKLSYSVLSLFFILVLFSAKSQAQTWTFAGSGGSANAENGKAICVDASGNVYVTGSFSNTVDFDLGAGTANLTSNGSNDIFIASYTSTGTYRWAVRAGGTGNDNTSPSGGICTDGTNVYVTGSYNGAATLFGAISLTPNGGSGTDAFVAKLNCTTGAWTWAVSMGGTGNVDSGVALCLDPSGNPYLLGSFNLTMSGACGNVSLGGSDIFVSKLNPASGACVWMANGGSATNDGTLGGGICYDLNTTEIVVASNITAGGGTFGGFSVSSFGNIDLCILELNSSTGAWLGAVGAGSATNDDAIACAYDPSTTNVMVCGAFTGNMTLPGGISLTNSLATIQDAWCGSYSVSANGFVWAKAAVGTGLDRANSIAVDGAGSVLVTGQYVTNPTTFGALSLTNTNSGGFDDMFVVNYSAATGTEIWATKNTNSAGPQASLTAGRGIAYDGSNNYWFTGQNSLGSTFNVVLPSNGFADFYIAKLNAPPPLSATQSQVNLTCNGICNGSATVVASGGTSPYTYSWSPSGGTGATASSLCAGSYTCTITDATTSFITKTFNITQPSAINLNPNTQTNVSCFGGSNGAASVVAATGGTGSFTYNWTPGNPTGDGTVSVTGLTAGVWTCTATDANSCTAQRTFNVTQPTAIVVTPASQTNISCFGGSNGAASINTPTGGAGGFTYNWTPGNPTGDGTVSVTGLTVGVWTCTVTDANSCTAQQTFNITQPTAITLNANSQTNISCFGGSNGAASVVPATGGAGGFTYNWTPGNPTGDGTVSVTGLIAGTWTCTVTDANSCTAQRTFNVTQPTAIVVTPASQTNISCNGGSNGAASINTPTGGAGGFTYNWTPGNPTGDGTVSVTGLTVGVWTCTVTDANACTAQQTFNITQPAAIVVTPASQTNILCNGGSNGAASINTPTGGAGGFTYNWTPGNPTGDGTVSVTGLTVGVWTCTVTDANACTAQQTFNITQPAIINASTSSTPTACVSNTGTATVSGVTGGTGGYTYSWAPSGGTAATATSLGAGTYTCTVTDANTCTRTFTAIVSTVSGPSLTAASQTNINCFGGSSGAASVNAATGGTSPYTYNWTPGNPTGDGTVSVTGLTVGVWTCTVTDANSCTAQQTFNITQPAAIVVTPASQTNISCFGGSNGAASINTPTGGAGGFTYNWTPGNPTGDGTVSVTGLAVGVWTCTVTDANACTAQQTFNITQPTAIVVTPASQTNISCFGGSNGAASINTPTGGAGGFTYNWTPGNPTGDGTVSVTGLTVGVWTCTVTDANSCTAQQTFNITQPSAIVVTPASQTNISCNGGSNGAASINTPTGGAGGYTYNWTPGNPTGDGTVSVTGLTVGVWTCTVTDANSCTATQTFNITQPAIINASTSSTPTACVSNTGTATVSGVTGGTGGYTYSWAPSGGTAATATGLGAGTYTCTVTDANTCTRTFTAIVSTVSGPSLTAASQTNISCFGGSSGAASVNAATGGTSPYTYNWTPGNPAGDGTVSVTGLTVGVWTCTVTDANSCTAQQTFNITQPTAIVVTPASQTNISCNGGSNGAASINTPTGGAGGFTYNWTPGNPTGDGTVSVTGLAVGVWTCTVTDANACTAQQTFNITQPSTLAVSPASQTNVTCFGGSNGAASINTPTGGAGGFTYNWTPGNPTGDGTVSVTGLTIGVWTCTVTDANSCTAQQTFNITQPAPVSVGFTVSPNDTVCAGTTVTLSGTGANSYSWTGGINNGVGFIASTTTTYTVTGTNLAGCTNTATATITVNPLPTVGTNVTPNDTVCVNTLVTLSGTGANTYTWSGGVINNTPFAAAVLGNTTYTVTGTSVAGCSNTASIQVHVNALPVVNLSGNTNLCPGGTVTLTGSSGGTSQWYVNGVIIPGANTNTYLANTPGVYNMIKTNANGCFDSAAVGLTVVPVSAPTVGTNVTPGTTVCENTSVTLSGTGASSYTWTGGITNGVGFNAVTTATYTVTGTDGNSCTNTSSVTITVNPLPLVGASVDNDTICLGGSVIFTGSGANSYTWDNGVTDGIAYIPTATNTYTVTGTDGNNCSNTNSVTVIVNPLPTVGYNVTPNDTVCIGTSVTLSGTGAGSYTWTGGITDGNPFTPLANGTYTVTGTDANLCVGTNTVAIVVNPLPVVNLGPDVVQPNPPAVLDAGAGFSAYLWNTTANTQTISVNTNGTYFVSVTDSNGCSNADTINVNFTSGINNPDGSQATIELYPVPTENVLNLSIQNLHSADLVVTILDMNGKIIEAVKVGNFEGNYNKTFITETYRAGMYTMVIQSAEKTTNLRFIKK